MAGAEKAWAVDGTPADTVQLALSGSLFEVASSSGALQDGKGQYQVWA